MIDDMQLLQSYVRTGSNAAFAEIVRRRIGLVYTVARRVLGQRSHLAEDVTQQVFVKLAKQSSGLLGRSTLSGWLHRVAHYTAIDVLRSEKRRQFREECESLSAAEGGELLPEADWTRLHPVLDEVMGKLSQRARDVLALRFLEGRTLTETAGALDLPEEATRKRIERALNKMERLLARKGIKSTTVALTLALAENAALAAPMGLAAKAVGKATAAMSRSGGWTGLGWLRTSKVTTGCFVAAVIAVGLVSLEGLRSKNDVSEKSETAVERRELSKLDYLPSEDGEIREAEHPRPPTRAVPPIAQKATANVEVKRDALRSVARLRMIQLNRSAQDTDWTLLIRAEHILTRWRAGESFEVLAREFSIDARSEKGGDWGWQSPRDLKPVFRDVLVKLEKGAVSSPLLNPAGCFLLYVEDWR